MSTVRWDIGVDGPITPDAALPPMPGMAPGDVLVITGRAPAWRYLMAFFHAAHGSPAAAIASHDPRLGDVIVATHNPAYAVGQIV